MPTGPITASSILLAVDLMMSCSMLIAILSLLCSFSACKIDTYDEGFDDGYKAGRSEGYQTGYRDGYKVGRSSGYDAGYFDGYRAAGGSFADDFIKEYLGEDPTSPQD